MDYSVAKRVWVQEEIDKKDEGGSRRTVQGRASLLPLTLNFSFLQVILPRYFVLPIYEIINDFRQFSLFRVNTLIPFSLVSQDGFHVTSSVDFFHIENLFLMVFHTTPTTLDKCPSVIKGEFKSEKNPPKIRQRFTTFRPRHTEIKESVER